MAENDKEVVVNIENLQEALKLSNKEIRELKQQLKTAPEENKAALQSQLDEKLHENNLIRLQLNTEKKKEGDKSLQMYKAWEENQSLDALSKNFAQNTDLAELEKKVIQKGKNAKKKINGSVRHTIEMCAVVAGATALGLLFPPAGVYCLAVGGAAVGAGAFNYKKVWPLNRFLSKSYPQDKVEAMYGGFVKEKANFEHRYKQAVEAGNTKLAETLKLRFEAKTAKFEHRMEKEIRRTTVRNNKIYGRLGPDEERSDRWINQARNKIGTWADMNLGTQREAKTLAKIEENNRIIDLIKVGLTSADGVRKDYSLEEVNSPHAAQNAKDAHEIMTGLENATKDHTNYRIVQERLADDIVNSVNTFGRLRLVDLKRKLTSAIDFFYGESEDKKREHQEEYNKQYLKVAEESRSKAGDRATKTVSAAQQGQSLTR